MKSEMNRVKRSINKIRRNKNTQKFRLHVLLPLTERFVKTTEQIYTKPGWRTSLGSEQTSLTFGADPHEGICACWVLVNVAVEVCFFESDLFSVWSRLIRLKGAIGSCWVLLGLVGSCWVKLFLGSLWGSSELGPDITSVWLTVTSFHHS